MDSISARHPPKLSGSANTALESLYRLVCFLKYYILLSDEVDSLQIVAQYVNTFSTSNSFPSPSGNLGPYLKIFESAKSDSIKVGNGTSDTHCPRKRNDLPFRVWTNHWYQTPTTWNKLRLLRNRTDYAILISSQVAPMLSNHSTSAWSSFSSLATCPSSIARCLAGTLFAFSFARA